MANQEHIDLLMQGVEVWNKWREEHPEMQPDLREVSLRGHDLIGLNLSGAELYFSNLYQTNLARASLSGAILSGAHLVGTRFTGADLRNANCQRANLRDAKLAGADLSEANLLGADLARTDLKGAKLYGADLSEASLNRTDLKEADLSGVYLRETIFAQVDLRSVKGLATVKHSGRSSLDIHTFVFSEGQIPDIFLRGIGISDSFIAYMHSLVGKPIDYYTCFISYSSKDQDFVERLHADLQSNGVRCWFAPEDMKIGDKIRIRIDEAIRLHDKLLLVLTEHSVRSDWVEKEVETAFEKEQQMKRLVLFPIRLDDTVMQTNQAWAADIRRMRHIGDFSNWKNHDEYQKALNRLLRDLKSERTRRL